VQCLKELLLLPHQRISWIEEETAERKLGNISLREVSRCFTQGRHILFDQLTFNGTPLLPFQLDNGSDEEFQKQFFVKLLSFLYNRPIDVQMLGEASLLAKEKDGEQKTNPDVQKLILCADILKLCTLNGWSQAHDCLMARFGALFSDNLWTRASQGISCQIVTENLTKFKVTQHKRYTTYRTLSPGSKSIDQAYPLCTLTLSWTLEPVTHFGKKTWRGTLQIVRWQFFEENLNEGEKQMLIDTLLQGVK
jgi:hypothetical protein